MPRNGSGTYSLVNNTWYPPVTGVSATATDWTPFINDVAAALTQSVSSDGQTPLTGNLPMGGNKITGLATGTAATDAVNVGQVSSNVGQCRLVKSGANLVLQPYQGNRLTINGVIYTIPSAGVSLAPTGATVSTLYFIYAYMVAAVMTLEYSVTAHSTDTNTGVEIKTGDATRTLVGMAYPVTGPAWVDTTAQRYVLSWFNRKPLAMGGALPSSVANGNTAYTDISGSLILQCLSWAGDGLPCSIQGGVSNTTSLSYQFSAIYVNGVASGAETFGQCFAASAMIPIGCGYTHPNLTDNALGFSLRGKVSSGTGTWNGGAGGQCSINVITWG